MNKTVKDAPRYRCHKIVQALEIERVANTHLFFKEEGFPPAMVGTTWVEQHRAEPGGYYIRYEDGYTSYSPKKAFEEGYTRIED